MANVTPVKVKLVVDDTRTADGIRVDENGCVVLSERDVERIAIAVAAVLAPNAKQAPATNDPEPYFPVARNAPRREMTEY